MVLPEPKKPVTNVIGMGAIMADRGGEEKETQKFAN